MLAIVARDCLLPEPRCRCPAAARQRGSGVRQSRATIPFSCMSRFNLDLRGSKPKYLSPRFLLNLGRDNPHYESRCVETPKNPTQSSLFTKSLRQPYLMLRVMRHNTNSKTVTQITRKCTALCCTRSVQQRSVQQRSVQRVTVCVFSHTHTHTHVVLAQS